MIPIFFNQQTGEQIVIQITLAQWDETHPAIQKFFQERKFAQYKCGLGPDGPVPEPADDAPVALSVSLRVEAPSTRTRSRTAASASASPTGAGASGATESSR